MSISRRTWRGTVLCAAILGVTACSDGFDFDMRSLGNGFDTTDAVRQGAGPRPAADDRGVISYPSYQVVVAREQDTAQTVAARVGVSAEDLARFNGIPAGVELRGGELLVLPSRVSEPTVASGAAPGTVDVTAVAESAIARSSPGQAIATQPVVQSGEEPIRHRVARGETAFSIARLYGVSVRSLGEWNGLGPDLSVREGQFLLIPVARGEAPAPEPAAVVTAPGTGSPTPPPPSSVRALPDPEPAAAAPEPEPASPALSEDRTAASDTSELLMPVSGSIIRPYEKGTNDGIGIAAPAGTPVRAADAGTVAIITRDTEGDAIVVIRHDGDFLTVYQHIEELSIEKGDSVSRGQQIAVVRDRTPSMLHFEVRQGINSLDPMEYLQ